MPMYDMNAIVSRDYHVNDRFEADSPEEAKEKFEANIRAGEYDDQFWEGDTTDVMIHKPFLDE